MKILYIVPYVPNLIRVRSYELLRTLAQRDHQITLATLWSTPQDQADLQALAAMGIELVAQPLSMHRSLWNSVCALPTRSPLQAVYCWQPALAQQLQRRLQTTSFEVIHVEHLRGAAYGLDLKRAMQRTALPTPVVWDSVDCISHLFYQAARHSKRLGSRLLTQLELRRTPTYEGALVWQFVRTLVTSQVDRQALYDLAIQACVRTRQGEPTANSDDLAQRLVVLPNGVDLAYFCPTDGTVHPAANEQQPATIVFSGKMSYHANVTAVLHLVQEIMPLVWRHRPDVRVQIVGKDPPAVIRALATQGLFTPKEQNKDQKSDQKPEQRGCVEVTGTVPHVPPYLRQATIAVAPVLYSAGIQNKVLEALACGTPVVANAQAVAGIAARAGQDFLLAAHSQHFADQILALLHDPQRRQQLGAAGRRYVEQHHSWPTMVDHLEQIYQTTMTRP